MKKILKSPSTSVMLISLLALLLMGSITFFLLGENLTQADFDSEKPSMLENLASDPTYQSYVVNSKKFARLINTELKAGKDLVSAFQKYEDYADLLTGQYQELEVRYPDFLALDEQLLDVEPASSLVQRTSAHEESGGCNNMTYNSCIRRAVSEFVKCRDGDEKPLGQCATEYGQYVEMCVTFFCHL